MKENPTNEWTVSFDFVGDENFATEVLAVVGEAICLIGTEWFKENWEKVTEEHSDEPCKWYVGSVKPLYNQMDDWQIDSDIDDYWREPHNVFTDPDSE